MTAAGRFRGAVSARRVAISCGLVGAIVFPVALSRTAALHGYAPWLLFGVSLPLPLVGIVIQLVRRDLGGKGGSVLWMNVILALVLYGFIAWSMLHPPD